MTVAGVAKSVYREGWEQAMREEFEGHLGTGTFSFVDGAPEGRRPVSSKWCVSWKTNKTHATLDEEVFLRLPAGCGDKSHNIVKAERAIYGLKQSGRQWGYHAADTLVENGFERCNADPCVFRMMVDEVVVMIIVINVDDFLVAGSDEDCEELLASLNKKFPTKNLGECEWFDGYAIERDVETGTLKISQTA
ncbi:unnamed protein product [Ectocarpus sp. CCAP 1310/34]|nr:unnamed protein product [Ectocarpus sp. CCAP 1310/34]